MPFDPSFDDVFHYGVQPVIVSHDMRCVRIDREVFAGDVTARIHGQIDAAEVVIADVSGANPNVYYEVGYAQRANRPTILICATDSLPEFNVRGLRCLLYRHIVDLERQLSHELTGLLQAPDAQVSALEDLAS
jgi:nucleoside 2-deoxyribosyltransferase